MRLRDPYQHLYSYEQHFYVVCHEMWPTVNLAPSDSSRNGPTTFPLQTARNAHIFLVDSKIYPNPHTTNPQRAKIKMVGTPAV